MSRARSVVMTLLAGLAGCVDCPDLDTRGANMSAQISAPGAAVEQVIQINVEEVGNLAFRRVGFVVTGANLRWHVRGVRLVEGTGDGRVLYDIPLEMPGANGNTAATGQVTDTDPAAGTWEQFLVLLETGGIVVELTTDVEGLERVQRPIRDERASEWYSPPCPYTD